MKKLKFVPLSEEHKVLAEDYAELNYNQLINFS